MSTGVALLFAYVMLAVGFLLSDGFYLSQALFLLLVGFGMLVAAFVWAFRGHPFDAERPGSRHFAAALLFLLVLSVVFPALYARSPYVDTVYRVWIALLVVGVAVGYLLLAGRMPWLRKAVFTAAVVVSLAFAAYLPGAVEPPIDSYAMSQQSAHNLLAGENPYATPIDTAGDTAYGYDLQGYTYLPADLYLQTASYGLTGDVRYVTVLAYALIALALFKLARKRWPAPIAELITLLFLYHPRGLYTLEQAWIDPLVLMLFALFMLAWDSERPWMASIAYGYMLFMKQTNVFAFFQWLIIERRWKHVMAGLGIGVATIVPFVLADPQAFVDNAIMFNVSIPFRPDSLTVWGFLYERFGLTPPPFTTVIVGAALTVLTAVPLRRTEPRRGYLFAVPITFFGMFLFGSQAFGNYYHFVAGIVLFALAAGAVRSGRSPGPVTDTMSA